MRLVCKSHVTHVNESREWVMAHMEWVMQHVWKSHVTHVNECITSHWNMSCHACRYRYVWMHHVTHVNASHVCVCIMSHMWIHHMCVTSHVTNVNALHVCDKSCHTCECIVLQVNKSCHTCEHVMSHVSTNKKFHAGTSHFKHVNKWFISAAQHIYIHVYFVHRTEYMYTTTTVHLEFFRALQVSRPDTRAHIRVLHMQYVCEGTHTHTTHTHQPPVKNGETLPSPKRIHHTGNKRQP